VKNTKPEFLTPLLGHFAQQPKQEITSIPSLHGSEMIETLSLRELEVLRLLAAGLSNAEIGSKLFISLGTVKWHVKNIFGKLGVGSRTQAVAYAHELGLLKYRES